MVVVGGGPGHQFVHPMKREKRDKQQLAVLTALSQLALCDDDDDVVEVQPRLCGPERARGLTRLPLQPADKEPVRHRLPVSRPPPHHHHHHHHHNLAPLDSLRL